MLTLLFLDHSAKSLCLQLGSKCRELKDIHFGQCYKISDEGMIVIAKGCLKLQRIYMQENKLVSTSYHPSVFHLTLEFLITQCYQWCDHSVCIYKYPCLVLFPHAWVESSQLCVENIGDGLQPRWGRGLLAHQPGACHDMEGAIAWARILPGWASGPVPSSCPFN